MPKGYPPSVFVSSTCYDLNQVRVDLKRFLSDMGFDPVLSETPAFPVTPQISPVENCLKAVKERADIFVLIVGARYGSQNDSGKSITNLEYLEAKAKGLPIYVFVLKQIINVLPIWKQNPNGNYDSVVDTPKLFEFVDSLHSSQDHWVFQFDEVLHIINTLRNQLAYLFTEGLILREKVKSLKLPPALTDLSGKSLKLLLERPIAWEYNFLSSVLADQIERDRELKWDLKYGLKLKNIQTIEDPLLICQWFQQKFGKIRGLINSFDKLMNSAVKEALGPPGRPGDAEHLVYVARRLAFVRRELLEWTIEFACTEVSDNCKRLHTLISEFSRDAIEQIENIPSRIDSEILTAIEAKKRGEEYVANIMVTLSELNGVDEIASEFQKLSGTI